MSAYLVEHARRELVRRYRANPRLWPDGIDGVPGSGCEQWYRGHEHATAPASALLTSLRHDRGGHHLGPTPRQPRRRRAM